MSSTSPVIGALIRSGEFYDEIYQFNDDIPFYVKRSGVGRVLELCAGTGRVSIPLAEAGKEVVAVDFAQSMLDRATTKATAGGIEIQFHLADITKLDLGRRFASILLPFNSLEDFYTTESIERVLRTVRQHSHADTHFLFDVNNPQLASLKAGVRHVPLRKKFTVQGKNIEIKEKMAYDSIKQINSVIRTYTIDGVSSDHPLDLRVYFPEELDALLKSNGFEVIQKFGDFQESPFTSESLKQIFVCRLAT